MSQMKHTDFGLGFGTRVDGFDDLHHVPDIGLGVGHHNGVAGCIGHEGRLG